MKRIRLGVLAAAAWAGMLYLVLRPPDWDNGLYVFALILGSYLLGLAFTAGILALSLSRTRRSVRMMALIAFFLVGLTAFASSPLAPSWSCLKAGVQVALASPDRSCTTKCTSWTARPCSGWSSCYNKFISCSSGGIDQNGRSCKGCCFSCKVVCDDPPATPTPTPTPMPPTISGSISCDQAGNNGWCIGNATLILTASDPQGYATTISGDINGAPFSCPGPTCSQALPEGTGAANYLAASSAGASGVGSSNWRRDSTPPSLSPGIPAVDGANGWRVSAANVSVAASDSLSGLASVGISVDGEGEQAGPVQLGDGVHTLVFRAVDLAGNVTTRTSELRIDTTAPSSAFSAPADGSVVNGMVALSGQTIDAVSGPAFGEISLDGGATWQPVTLDAAGSWSYSWDTQGLPNGVYTLLMRAVDTAGNQEHTARTTVILDNEPPFISLTPGSWMIWSSGQLTVRERGIPLKSVAIRFKDPQKRWSPQVQVYHPGEIPSKVSWDRILGNGIYAPWGDYIVVAQACDIYDNCANAKATITIPYVPPPTSTPTPTATPTMTATLAPPTPAPTKPAAVTPPLATSTLAPAPTETLPVTLEPEPDEPVWPLATLGGLTLLFSALTVLDPRPAALKGLEALGRRWMEK